MAAPDPDIARAGALLKAGQLQQGADLLEALLRAPCPAHVLGEANLLLAQALWALGRAVDATQAARRGVEALPDRRDCHGVLANFLLRQERFADALDAATEALQRFPGDAEFLALRASMLLTIGRPEDAVSDLRTALERSPENIRLLGALGPALNYAPGFGLEEIRRVHAAYGEALTRALPPRPPAVTCTADPSRRLRLGLLSPDFRRHAMWHFIHPILAHLDRDRFDVHCYFTGGQPDEGTASLQALGGATWNHVPALHVGHLADKIAADSIDVLIDFAGHTRFNRLGTLALKPAPVQINFTGYPCTTGVAQTDYHVTDSVCSPPGFGHEEAFVERLLRVDPVFFCYQPPEAAMTPDVTPCPSEAAGHVTFGSCNTLMKLNDRVVRAWARVVRAVPGSRLIVKNAQLSQAQAREVTRRRFYEAGLSDANLELLGHEGTQRDHLTTYARIDIGLDTFPYAGMTTTCESLLMGVPVVTLPQQTFASRVGLSILSQVGLADLAATSEDEFVQKAVSLAAEPARRAKLRAELRSTFLGSQICDARGYAAGFGEELRRVWARHAKSVGPTGRK